jgi:hypothetical protein
VLVTNLNVIPKYVYKLKRNAKTGAAYRFKARLIVRGFEMVKGLDYEDTFSPTPGISIARLMVSIATANDLELHSVDIEQTRRVQERGYHKHGQPFLAENDGENIAESLHSAASIHTATSISPVNTPATTTLPSPEDLNLQFLNMTGIKVSTVRFDGAQEFGKSLSFQAFCRKRGIVMDLIV